MDRVKGLLNLEAPVLVLCSTQSSESQSATDAPYSTEGVPFLSSELHI